MKKKHLHISLMFALIFMSIHLNANNIINQNLKGQWFSTNGENEWIIGFFDNYVIYKAAKWSITDANDVENMHNLRLSNSSNETIQISVKLNKPNEIELTDERGKPAILSNQYTSYTQYNTDDEKIFNNENILMKDTIRIHGILRNYLPQSKHKTIKNFIENSSGSEVILSEISADGYFELKYYSDTPQYSVLIFNDTPISYYAEPGEPIFLLIDSKTNNTNALFMGAHANTNVQLNLLEENFSFENEFMSEMINKYTPDEFKQLKINQLKNTLNKVQVFTQNNQIGCKAKQIFDSQIKLSAASQLSEYNMYSSFQPIIDSSKIIPPNYTDFLYQIGIDDVSMIISNSSFFHFMSNSRQLKPLPFLQKNYVSAETTFPKYTLAKFIKDKNINLPSRNNDYSLNSEQANTNNMLPNLKKDLDLLEFEEQYAGETVILYDKYTEILSKLSDIKSKYPDIVTQYVESPEYKKQNTKINTVEINNEPIDIRSENEQTAYIDIYLDKMTKFAQISQISPNATFLELMILSELKSNLNRMNDKERTYAYNKLKKQIQKPLPKKYLNQLLQENKQDNKKSYQLPNTKGGAIFKRIVDPHKGKHVIVDFWGIFCGPCIYAIENIWPVAHEKYRNSDKIAFIYIANELDSPIDRYNEYVNKHLSAEVTHLLSNDEFNYLLELFQFNGIPRYILVGPEGNILNDNFFTMNPVSDIEKLITD